MRRHGFGIYALIAFDMARLELSIGSRDVHSAKLK
jgi:hypothetical protein